MALNIVINKEYRITSDGLNVILQRRRIVDPTKSPNWSRMKDKGADPTPRDEWRDVGYYNTVEAALNGIVDRRIKESDAQTVCELISEIRQIRREISEVLRQTS
jgi:hypothetical protein